MSQHNPGRQQEPAGAADLLTLEMAWEGGAGTAAERAIATGEPVVFARLVLVPDLFMLSGVANGHEAAPTVRLERDDGRAVYVYRLPAGWPHDGEEAAP